MKRAICLFFLMSLILMSCDMKSRGWWREDRIAIIADPQDWEAAQAPLRQIFEKVVRTPQRETLYNLHLVPVEEINRYTKFRYLILVATLKSRGEAGRMINGIVASPDIRNRIQSGEQVLFILKEQFAKNQIMAILIAPDLIGLREAAESSAERLFHTIHNAVKEDIENRMYEKKWGKRLAEDCMSSFGWRINFQKDYFMAQKFPRENFVWFRRTHPERWVFVRWIEYADTSYLNQDWVVRERNRIGSLYYGNDQVEEEYLYSYQGDFLGRQALITTGLWGNEEKFAGGPFKNYTFYDPVSERIYMIDLAVHAPQKDKLPLLKRMDIMAHTFKSAFDR